MVHSEQVQDGYDAMSKKKACLAGHRQLTTLNSSLVQVDWISKNLEFTEPPSVVLNSRMNPSIEIHCVCMYIYIISMTILISKICLIKRENKFNVKFLKVQLLILWSFLKSTFLYMILKNFENC